LLPFALTISVYKGRLRLPAFEKRGLWGFSSESLTTVKSGKEVSRRGIVGGILGHNTVFKVSFQQMVFSGITLKIPT